MTIKIFLKPEIWFYCSKWNWVVRAGNCVECEHYEKVSCPHPERANNYDEIQKEGEDKDG